MLAFLDLLLNRFADCRPIVFPVGQSKHILDEDKDVSLFLLKHLYLHQEYASIVQPEKRLVSSQRIYLEANQEKQARINIPISDLAIFDNNGNSWIEEGVYHFYLNVDGLESVTTWEYKQ